MFDICYQKYNFVWFGKKKRWIFGAQKSYSEYIMETFPYLINSFSFLKFEFLLVLSKILLNYNFARNEIIQFIENASAKVFCLFDGTFLFAAQLQIIKLFMSTYIRFVRIFH